MKNRLYILSITLLIAALSTNGLRAEEEQKQMYRVVAVNSSADEITSTSNQVEVKSKLKLFIPTGFTPNGDGLNDKFEIVSNGTSGFKLEIFDRWGELIFVSNDIKNSWDGTYMGNKAPLGTYVYKLSIADEDLQELTEETGSISLMN